MITTKGYKVHIITPEGNLLEEVVLDQYNFERKSDKEYIGTLVAKVIDHQQNPAPPKPAKKK